MKSSVSLLLFFLFPFADGTVPCDHQDAIQSMECKPLLGNLAGEMAKHADMPPPDELKQFSEMCEEALVSTSGSLAQSLPRTCLRFFQFSLLTSISRPAWRKSNATF